jgi:SAM-dependent methyltransferase
MAIHCVVADGQELPFPENQFHYCTAHFSVIFFESPLKGMQQIYNCLQPGGRVVISAWGSAEETPAFQVVKDAFADIAPYAYPGTSRITGSPQVLTELLQEAGFVDIDIQGPITRILHVDSPEAYYDRFVCSSPKLQTLLQTVLTKEVALALKQRVMELATQRGGGGRQPDDDGSIQLPAKAYFAYGRKKTEKKA